MSRTNVLMQLGEYCTTHHCKNCPIGKLATENHNGCPEVLRFPQIAEEASKLIRQELPKGE